MPSHQADPKDPDPIDSVAQKLAENLLATSRSIEASHRLARDLAIVRAVQTEQREGSLEVQLAQAIGNIATRMTDLHKRPNRRNWRGHLVPRSLVQVHYEPLDVRQNFAATVWTEPVDDGVILQQHGVHYLRSGVSFNRFQARHDSPVQLTIKQVIKDERTSATVERQLYDLMPIKSPTGPRVLVHNPRFKAYREAQRAPVFARYAAENDWFNSNNYAYEEGYAIDQPGVFRRLDIDEERFVSGLKDKPAHMSNMDFANQLVFERIKWFGEYDRTNLNRLEVELLPYMYPGVSWEYPDEMFIEPLGMVLEANALLGVGK